MKCECGYKAFYYQKIEDNKKLNVYKCGHVAIESKRKTKCDMNIIEYVSDITHIHNKDYTKSDSFHVNKEDPEKKYREELHKLIYLCDITKDFSSVHRFSYIANINFILNKLGFPLYFEEKETLDSLKTRINCKANYKLKYKPETKTILVEVPEYLAVHRKNSKSIKKSKKKITSHDVKTPIFLINEVEPDEDVKNEKEEILISGSDSDSDYMSNEEDNMFDVDNYDSENDNEDNGDDGAFSD
jgi:hypothetical protein